MNLLKRLAAWLWIGDVNWDALSRLNPDDFTAEEVASCLGIRLNSAEWVCQIAVRRREFQRLANGHFQLALRAEGQE